MISDKSLGCGSAPSARWCVSRGTKNGKTGEVNAKMSVEVEWKNLREMGSQLLRTRRGQLSLCHPLACLSTSSGWHAEVKDVKLPLRVAP